MLEKEKKEFIQPGKWKPVGNEYLTYPLLGPRGDTFSEPNFRVKFPSTSAKEDPDKQMKALTFYGTRDVRIMSRSKPMITEPLDAILKVTATTICGSDLHLYENEFSGMKSGDILGHEFMGIIESVGEGVRSLKVGDRVVVSAVIACGQCSYCKAELFSLCDWTNPSKEMERNYGHRTSGIFGYSHLTGGYDGGQAEYVRVPLADFNCLKVPNELSDEKVLFLSDIACTGWHANELGGVCEGCTVAIWGAGPVGLMSAMWAKFRGASQIVMIDNVEYRLRFARDKLGVRTINFSEANVHESLMNIFKFGPDVCIDCVGFRFPKSLSHKIQRSLRLETDCPEVLIEMIHSVRKGGSLAIIGDYLANTNNFPIGAFMEKGLTMRGGQVFVHKYWRHLLGFIEKGFVDPSFVITHRMDLDKASDAYKKFDNHEDNCIKVLLLPHKSTTVSTTSTTSTTSTI